MIKDYNVYNERMSKTLFDKAFFIDKIYGAEIVVDFGCADGSLIRYLNKIAPDLFYIGYDNDPVMIKIAASKTKNSNICFVSSLEEIEFLIGDKRWAINFSSVLHEIDDDSLEAVKALIDRTKPNYICARDMYYNCQNLSSEAMCKIEKENLWKDYIKKQPISTLTYICYLLKRTYAENWEKEKNEDYFSAFCKFFWLRSNDYKIIWDVKYCLPYQKLQWLHDFNFDYNKEQFTTHRQLIVSNMFNL